MYEHLYFRAFLAKSFLYPQTLSYKQSLFVQMLWTVLHLHGDLEHCSDSFISEFPVFSFYFLNWPKPLS